MKEIGRNRELIEKVVFSELKNGVYLLRVDMSDMREGSFDNELKIDNESDIYEFVIKVNKGIIGNKDIEDNMIEFNENEEEEEDKVDINGMLDMILENYREYVNWIVLYKY